MALSIFIETTAKQTATYTEYVTLEVIARLLIMFCFHDQDCVFTKLASDTALKVEYNGDLRIAGCLDCCKRWYFTFDGAECKVPLAIGGLVHIASNHGRKDSNIHRVHYIGGYCQGISAGAVRVGINVGDCASKKSGSDAYTGWNSVTRIMIEEVPPPQK